MVDSMEEWKKNNKKKGMQISGKQHERKKEKLIINNFCRALVFIPPFWKFVFQCIMWLSMYHMTMNESCDRQCIMWSPVYHVLTLFVQNYGFYGYVKMKILHIPVVLSVVCKTSTIKFCNSISNRNASFFTN